MWKTKSTEENVKNVEYMERRRTILEVWEALPVGDCNFLGLLI